MWSLCDCLLTYVTTLQTKGYWFTGLCLLVIFHILFAFETNILKNSISKLPKIWYQAWCKHVLLLDAFSDSLLFNIWFTQYFMAIYEVFCNIFTGTANQSFLELCEIILYCAIHLKIQSSNIYVFLLHNGHVWIFFSVKNYTIIRLFEINLCVCMLYCVKF